MKRLYKPVVFGCALMWLAAMALRAEVAVPLVRDLQSDGLLAQQQQLPILLTFTASYCDYCDLLEEEFLQPMLLSGEYEDKIIIRKLVLDNGSRLTDFSGHQVSAARLADSYRVTVTPTILFVDAERDRACATHGGYQHTGNVWWLPGRVYRDSLADDKKSSRAGEAARLPPAAAGSIIRPAMP